MAAGAEAAEAAEAAEPRRGEVAEAGVGVRDVSEEEEPETERERERRLGGADVRGADTRRVRDIPRLEASRAAQLLVGLEPAERKAKRKAEAKRESEEEE
jgi:hypothetical protein